MNDKSGARSDLTVAVDEYLETRGQVYAVDPDQILRDARGAREAARDHISRVVYELLQNAEDAGSDSFVVHLQADPPVAYFCDNGQGISSAAVKSLSGLFLSPKTSGIGRKGIGFKAVFSICAEPIVISKEDGIVFDKTKAKEWMKARGLRSSETPFQWLPFWISRPDATQALNVPLELREFRTIVALKLSSTETLSQISKDCSEFDPSSLLTFQNVRTFKVTDAKRKSFEIVVDRESESDASVALLDSRGGSKASWRLHRVTLDVPVNVLDSFEPEERERYRTASIVLGIERDLEGKIRHPRKLKSLLVYYPTRHRTPNKFLCHADFLVSSDRARIADPSSNTYNGWLGNQTASEMVSFANALSEELGHQTNLICAALKSVDDDDGSIGYIRKLIVREASTRLKVKSISGQFLEPRSCLLLSCAEAGSALIVARGLRLANRLACEDILGDQEAISALLQCGATLLNDVDLLRTLGEDIATGHAAPNKLALSMWRWLKATSKLHDTPALRSQDFADLLNQVSILPGRGRWYSPDQAQAIPFALCEEPAGRHELVQVAFCDDEVMGQLRQTADSDALVEFLRELGVETDPRIALIRALDAFLDSWELASLEDRVHPNTFLRLIAEWKLTEVERPRHLLGNVPVPVRTDNGKVEWIRAFEAYRVAGTNAKLMSLLIGDDKDVPIVKMAAVRSTGADEHVLEWLGCPTRPQIVSSTGAEAQSAERRRTYHKLSERNSRSTGVVDVGSVKSLSSIDVPALSDAQFSALLGLLAAGWVEYYKQHANKFVKYTYHVERHLELDEQWWEDVQHRLVPTSLAGRSIQFDRCRVVLPSNTRAFAPFVPAPLLPGISDSIRKLIRQWMESQLGLVLSPEKLTWAQWKELLEEFVPDVWRKSENPEPLARRVKDTYRTFLAWCKQSSVLNQVTVIVGKRARGKHDIIDTTDTPVYLNDELHLAKQCPDSVLLFECHETYRALAVQVMGLKRLSHSIVDRHRTQLVSSSPAYKNVHERFCAGRPFLLALLQTKHHDVEVLQHKELLERITIVEVEQLEYTASVQTASDTATVKFSRNAECVDNTVYVLSRESDSRVPVMAHAAREIARLVQLLEYERQIEAILVTEEPEALYTFLEDVGVSEDAIREALEVYEEMDIAQPLDDVDAEDKTDSPDPNRRGSTPRKEPQTKPQIEKDDPPESPAMPSAEVAVKCKDGRTTKYVVRQTAPEAVRGRTPEPRVKGEMTTSPRWEPSASNKRRIEESSRALCMQHLAKLGLSPVEMEYSSVGFDIRATRDGRELRVEVKGHLRQSNNASLTGPEWRMYVQSKLANSRYDWELWNVENLDIDAGETVLSQYIEIPDYAISADSFEVALAMCSIRKE